MDEIRTSVSLNAESSTNTEGTYKIMAASNDHKDTDSNGTAKLLITSPDPTAYVAKARITRPIPPPPSYNPMQFVQIKPCNLYQTAQQQLKKAEEVKRIQEIKKEEPEDWQNNLDSWKSSRRKRVEHIIDRVVEVKKHELEEYDRNRRKSKTFSEMIEERGGRGCGRIGRGKLTPLSVYDNDESNDLSDFGIGTSSASGKSSFSEDCDNSVKENNTNLEKSLSDNKYSTIITNPECVTSSDPTIINSPNKCEYTYEGAIQDYKQRVSKAVSGACVGSKIQKSNNVTTEIAKEPNREDFNENVDKLNCTRKSIRSGGARLADFRNNLPNDGPVILEKNKADLPKINISKRKEIFENASNQQVTSSGSISEPKEKNCRGVQKLIIPENSKVIEDPLLNDNNNLETKKQSGDLISIKDRLLSLKQQQDSSRPAKPFTTNCIDIPVPPLKERLSSLQIATAKEEPKKLPVLLVDERQLQIMRDEDENTKKQMKQMNTKSLKTNASKTTSSLMTPVEKTNDKSIVENSKLDVECGDNLMQSSAKAADERRMTPPSLKKAKEEQLNYAVQALAIEEHLLRQAADAANQIEAEFAEMSTSITIAESSAANHKQQPCQVEFSIDEALELALQPIDTEKRSTTTTKNSKSNTDMNQIERLITAKDTEKMSVDLISERQQGEELLLDQQIRNEPIYVNISKSTTQAEFIPIFSKTNQTNQTLDVNERSKREEEEEEEPNKPNENKTNALPKQTLSHFSTSILERHKLDTTEDEPYYQVPKCSEPYYDAPKCLRPIPVYENIEIYSGISNTSLLAESSSATAPSPLEPPTEKPPPPPSEDSAVLNDDESAETGDNWSSDNTYESVSNRMSSHGLALLADEGTHSSSPGRRFNSTKRIKKELNHKRNSFLGLEGASNNDMQSNFLELTVAPPSDMAKLLHEERRLGQHLLKTAICDSSDTGESRDSGVSENHSRQNSEPLSSSSEEVDRHVEVSLGLITNSSMAYNEAIYQNEAKLLAAQTPLLQKVKGHSSESWTESVTAAATKSLTEAAVTANAAMQSIEEKMSEQDDVLRAEHELLHLEEVELKRQRENFAIRENMARRELHHGAKMLMSANGRSLQDVRNGYQSAVTQSRVPSPVPCVTQEQQPHCPPQIYANISNSQRHYYQVETDYLKSMPNLNEISKQFCIATAKETPIPPAKPMRAANNPDAHPSWNYATNNYDNEKFQKSDSAIKQSAEQFYKTAGPLYSHPPPPLHKSVQNLSSSVNHYASGVHASNMTRNTLHAISATPKPKYTDEWVQNRKSMEFNSTHSDTAVWLSSHQQKRKSVPNACHYNNNDRRLVQETAQRALTERQRHSLSASSTPLHHQTGSGTSASFTGSSTKSCSNKPLPDSVIQTLTERLQSKGIGERRRLDQSSNTNIENNLFNANSPPTQNQCNNQQQLCTNTQTGASSFSMSPAAAVQQDKILSVSGKKKCSHCGDELGRGAAMIIESLLLFYHISCFKCCVCHIQLGDGLNGTDVRVRNQKLHCQNCYSNDEGIKFSRV